MNFSKLPTIAAFTALFLTACSEETGVAADAIDGISGNEIPGGEFPGSSAMFPGGDIPGSSAMFPGGDIPGSSAVFPGGEFPVSSATIPGGDFPVSSATIPGGDIPGSSAIFPRSSSSSPWHQYSSGTVNPGGNESGDDENDNEDSRTLNGTQILLKLSGTSATVENNNGCVEVADKKATITCPGAYYVTGESSDFQVVVNTPGAENEGNTGIYLYNATIKSSNSPILVANADKTVLHLVKGTTNVVEDGNGNHLFTKVNGAQDTSKAAIYARDDLNIKGAGSLTVKGKFKNGIQCSNDLKIKNGNITVEAEENAVKGKGSLQISGGTLNLTAKKGDGLESDECEEAQDGSCRNIIDGKGIVNISGGSVTINAADDGIDAANFIRISDSTEASTVKVTATGKGLVAEKFIYVDGGKSDVKSTGDDALHTHWQILLNAGEVTVNAKDDGIHADSALYMKGSTINVVTATEGIEAYKIFAEGGITSTFATNDGWNGAGGPKDPNAGGLSSFSESGGHIVVSGGYHYISSKGNMIDVFDANGSGKMTGGVLILEITGQSYESQGGMGMGMGMGWGMGGQGGNNCDAYNMAGGLIDTDTGFEITGGVLLAFGDFSTDTPGCASQTYNNSSYYGTDKAAFKPTYQGKHIFYGGDVKSVSQVNTAGMTEVKFPNGVSYMYK